MVIFDETVQAATGGATTGVAGPVLLGPPTQQKYGVMIDKTVVLMVIGSLR